MALFPTPAHLVAFYDPLFFSRAVNFHKWQRDVHFDFAIKKWEQPKQVVVVAPNGGGKSAMILAPCAAWTALSFFESLTVVTSATGAQLDTQTMPAVKRLAEHVNRYHRAELFTIKAKGLEFHPHHSPILPRKAGEEGTQEGFHPIVPGGEFTILVDEGKSMTEDIYNGIAKWTGWTRRCDISSAGEPFGVFYRMVTEGMVKPYIIIDDDCPNISEADKQIIYTQGGGKDSILARQALKSQFVSLAGQVVITLDLVQRCIRAGKEGLIPHHPEPENKCGLDLSYGGAGETVLCVANGNKQRALEIIPAGETGFQVERIVQACKHWELTNPRNRRADASGGGGKAVLDMLARAGWPFLRIFNAKMPVTPGKHNFGNKGTDMWFRLARLIEDKQVILLNDEKLAFQLSNRRYREHSVSRKIILMPKPEMRAEGLASPDRADATALCFDGYATPEETPEGKKTKLTGEELEQWFDDLHHGKFLEPAKLDGQITLEQVVGVRTQPGALERFIRR